MTKQQEHPYSTYLHLDHVRGCGCKSVLGRLLGRLETLRTLHIEGYLDASDQNDLRSIVAKNPNLEVVSLRFDSVGQFGSEKDLLNMMTTLRQALHMERPHLTVNTYYEWHSVIPAPVDLAEEDGANYPWSGVLHRTR